MILQNQATNINNIAYPITNNLVRVGNLLYPIKHSFVVGERWVEDPNAPAILECYNFVYRPPPVPQLTHFRTSNNFRASMKYAFSNYPTITEFDSLFGRDWTIGPHILQYLQETRGPDYEPISSCGLDSVYYGIGYYTTDIHEERKVSLPPIIPPIRTITTQSWRSPNVGTIVPDPDIPDLVIIGDGWFANEGWSNHSPPHLAPWGTDFVMWVYDWEWQLDGEILHFDPIESVKTLPGLGLPYLGINDDLFLPGQQGARVISRKFWNAPWERYPHLT